MIPDPLHPAIVHFPIVLMFLLPAAALVALVAIRRGAPTQPTWAVVLATALLLGGSAWLAVRTGGVEEERVEEVVTERVLETHEEQGERFMTLAALTAAIVALGLAPGRAGGTGRALGTLAALLLVGAGWQVGHSGGELVYRQGAADAYVTQITGQDREADAAGLLSRIISADEEHEDEPEDDD